MRSPGTYTAPCKGTSGAGGLGKGGGELRMPLGQRIAHMPPKGRRRIRDLGGDSPLLSRLTMSSLRAAVVSAVAISKGAGASAICAANSSSARETASRR